MESKLQSQKLSSFMTNKSTSIEHDLQQTYTE